MASFEERRAKLCQFHLNYRQAVGEDRDDVAVVMATGFIELTGDGLYSIESAKHESHEKHAKLEYRANFGKMGATLSGGVKRSRDLLGSSENPRRPTTGQVAVRMMHAVDELQMAGGCRVD